MRASRQTLTWMLCQMLQINLVPQHFETFQRKTTSSPFLKELDHRNFFLSLMFLLAGSSGSPDMIEHWIQLVHEKNALVSEESDLMVA